jgi:alpha-ketoglutarate-dependent taurine dioxygenase
MTREQAWPLIEELAEHATQERFVYYRHWRVGDALMWDERATMHRGAGDYRPDEHRIMTINLLCAFSQHHVTP